MKTPFKDQATLSRHHVLPDGFTGRETGQDTANIGSTPSGAGMFPPQDNTCSDIGLIHERNGIWVVTIGGIWRGDYVAREDAVAAVIAAGQDA